MAGMDKPALKVGARSMVAQVAAAVADAGRTIVVGPRRPVPGALFAREEPPGGGPVPALRAGLTLVEASLVAVLAGDLPFLLPDHVSALREEAGETGAVLVDAEGREQWLTGVWPTGRLREALADYAGTSLRGLLNPLTPRRMSLPGRAWFDCDTVEDLAEARRVEVRRRAEARRAEARRNV